MRIAYDHYAFCIQRYGGVSKYHIKLAEEIIKTDNQVRIFAPFHQNEYLHRTSAENYSSLSYTKYGKSTKHIYMGLNYIIGKRQIKKWKPDVGHTTYYSNKPSFSENIPSVVTVHDMIHEKFPHYFKNPNRITEIKKKTIDRSQHVICISENTRDDLISIFDTPPEKISVVYHGFEKSIINISSGYNEINKPFILYVGSRSAHKNFNRFIKAYASSKQLINNIGVIAFGGGIFTSEEKRLFLELGINNKYVEQIDGNDDHLSRLYSSAEAFIYPSLYEGFGLPPLEAMAHNCPVLSSNRSSMPEVIGEAALYFNPNDIDEISDAIKKVVFSDSVKSELIKKGRERLNQYSWSKCAKQTLRVYEHIKV